MIGVNQAKVVFVMSAYVTGGRSPPLEAGIWDKADPSLDTAKSTRMPIGRMSRIHAAMVKRRWGLRSPDTAVPPIFAKDASPSGPIEPFHLLMRPMNREPRPGVGRVL